MSYQKNKVLFGILFLIFIFLVLLMIFAAYTINVLSRGDQEGSYSSSAKSSIGVVKINGAIMDSKKTISFLHQAEKNKNIKAIIVSINSPGGDPVAAQEIYSEIRRIDQSYEKSKGEKGRPIYASFSSLATSGGYYIGAATRKIYANPATITGSIGVIMANMDVSRLLEMAKITPRVFKAGKFKDIGSPLRPMKEDEKKILQKTLDEVRQQFIRDILRTRKSHLKEDIEQLAQGQFFTGEAAKKMGLVDELASLWEAGRKIHTHLKLEGDFDLTFIKEKKKKGIWRVLDQLQETVSTIERWGQSLSFTGNYFRWK